MSTFIARSALQIFRDLVAKVVTLIGDLNLDDGGPETAILGAVSEEMALYEARLASLVKIHGLDAEGADLDDVVAQIMSGLAVSRGKSTHARCESLQITRASSIGEFPIPAGTIVFKSSDARAQYRTLELRTMVDGQAVYPGSGDPALVAVCLERGSVGRARPGEIDSIEGLTGVVDVTNIATVSSGLDEESDQSLKTRAQLLLAAIAKSQPGALRFLAGRWEAADGTTILHASCYETPGYTELMVDDGRGLENSTRPAEEVTGTIPPTGALWIPFDYPAATEPLVTLGANPAVAASAIPGAVVKYEQGRIEFLSGYAPAPGTTYSTSGHLVYTGAIAELQNAVEGDTFAAAVVDYGWRSAGTRVRLRPPRTSSLAVQLSVVWMPDVDPDDGQPLVTAEVESFFEALGIGEPYRAFDLYVAIGKALPDIVDDCVVVSPATVVWPVTPRHRLNVSAVTYGGS